MSDKERVLILCTGNSARSQMAEGLLRELHGDKFEVHSAGVDPSIVKPEAIEVMNEIGIDISGHTSKSADIFAGQEFDHIITVCDNAKEHCPYFPGSAKRIHRTFEDTASASGTYDDRVAAFRRVRDQISEYLRGFPGE